MTGVDEDQLALALNVPEFDVEAAGERGGLDLDLTPWLGDGRARERYWAKVYTGGGPDACWPWLGAISSSGHGKFHLGAGRDRRVCSAHRFGFQLAHGPLPPTPLGQRRSHGVWHRCDEHSCQNRAHLRWGPLADNTADYYTHARLRLAGPLADPRGRHGRAVAIRQAILEAPDGPVRLAAFRAAIAIPRPWPEQDGQQPLPA